MARLPAARRMLFVLAALAFPLSAGRSDDIRSGDSSVLQIDPLLIAQCAEVWKVIAVEHNRVWPGWNAAKTPVLFYLPGKQDVLINHPSPPPGFAPYTGPITFPGGGISIRNGPTIISLDGQNTSRDIGGVQTLVVADTLSNRKMMVAGLLHSAKSPEETLADLEYARLGSDAYGSTGMIAHEAFHVYQHHVAPNKAGNELALAHYPTLDVENNVGFALEGRALARAIRAPDGTACRAAAREWLAVRQHRRMNLSAEDIAYEDGTEFNEGLAMYVEYKLSQVLQGTRPSQVMYWVQGFHGYDDLSDVRQRLVDMMVRHMRGDVNVNNDPYGASPLRMRLYYSGMAIGVVLDKLGASWHEAILEPGTTLTALAKKAISPKDSEIQAAWSRLVQLPDMKRLRVRKQKLHDDGKAWLQSRLEGILDGDNSTLVLDYSALKEPHVAMAFTPFGIAAIDKDRTMFRLVPVSARLREETTLRQTRAADLLQDRAKKQLMCQLSQRVPRRKLLQAMGLPAMPEDTVKLGKLSLPGVELELGKVEVQWTPERITVVLR